MNGLKIYRKIKGGRWYLYKFGKDTPPINLFTEWTQDPPEVMDMNFCTLLHVEDYTVEKDE